MGDLPPDPELVRTRGEDEDANNQEVHRMIGWTTRKNYPLYIGISLPVPNQVGGEQHEGQLWEEFPDGKLVERNHANEVYICLAERLRGRSKDNLQPPEMPFSVEKVTMQTWKDGEAGFILFAPDDALMKPVKATEMQIMIKYEEGFMRVGMQNAYTMSMLSWEFQHLTQRNWGLFPLNGGRRLMDGTVVHSVTNDESLFHAALSCHEVQTPAPRVIEESGRGTAITNVLDQARLLRFWAWKQEPLQVGVLIPSTDALKVEYWMWVTLQPISGEDDLTVYIMALKEAWMERLREILDGLTDRIAERLGNEFRYKVRYAYNGL
jgi:hypothetical protein